MHCHVARASFYLRPALALTFTNVGISNNHGGVECSTQRPRV